MGVQKGSGRSPEGVQTEPRWGSELEFRWGPDKGFRWDLYGVQMGSRWCLKGGPVWSSD